MIQGCNNQYQDYSLLFARNKAIVNTTNGNYRDCDHSQTQLELNQCAKQNYQSIEQKLIQIYQQLRDEIKESNQEQKLILAESAWHKFRKLNCEYVSEAYKGGSIEPQIYFSCFSRLTEERIKHLESYLKNIQH